MAILDEGTIGITTAFSRRRCRSCEQYDITMQKLEDRIAWLEDHLAISENAEIETVLKRLYDFQPACNLVLSVLYRSKVVVTHEILHSILEQRIDRRFNKPRSDEIVSPAVPVYISRLRKSLGHDAIENIRGVGFKLTPKGRATLDAAFGR